MSDTQQEESESTKFLEAITALKQDTEELKNKLEEILKQL